MEATRDSGFGPDLWATWRAGLHGDDAGAGVAAGWVVVKTCRSFQADHQCRVETDES
jgi:hypothetical protein